MAPDLETRYRWRVAQAGLRACSALGITVLAFACLPSTARAYDEDVHSFLARSALKHTALDPVAAPVPDDAPTAVRHAIDAWARTSTDAAIRAEWGRRYPTPAAFDTWAEKELLLLAPTANVYGIDRLPDLVKTATSTLEVIALGAREPDDDRRNRDRLAYDARRVTILDSRGAEVPADPALLNMGKLRVLSSQAHAHYGLADLQLSDDPEVLKTDPRRFAVASGYPPGPVLTLAAEMAEAHLELALIAALLDRPSTTLAWLHTGQAFHYLQDICNQIHTVQVGIYDFFVDATLQRVLLAIRTGGGYFGELRSMSSIGIDILTNHHVLSEQLTKKRLFDALAGKATPEGTQLVEAPSREDPALESAFETALAPWRKRAAEALAFAADTPFGLVLTRQTIEASSHEGAAVYAATRAIVDPRFRKAGVLYDDHREDPDACLVPAEKRDAKAYAELFALEERGFTRAGTVQRKWIALEQSALAAAAATDVEGRAALRSAVIARLVRRQLRMLGEAEARRREYLAHLPPESRGPERMPLMLAGEIVFAGLVGLIVWRVARKRRPPEPVLS